MSHKPRPLSFRCPPTANQRPIPIPSRSNDPLPWQAVCRALSGWGYVYVENLTWVHMTPANAIAGLPGRHFRRSHSTLLMFRREGEAGKAAGGGGGWVAGVSRGKGVTGAVAGPEPANGHLVTPYACTCTRTHTRAQVRAATSSCGTSATQTWCSTACAACPVSGAGAGPGPKPGG